MFDTGSCSPPIPTMELHGYHTVDKHSNSQRLLYDRQTLQLTETVVRLPSLSITHQGSARIRRAMSMDYSCSGVVLVVTCRTHRSAAVLYKTKKTRRTTKMNLRWVHVVMILWTRTTSRQQLSQDERGWMCMWIPPTLNRLWTSPDIGIEWFGIPEPLLILTGTVLTVDTCMSPDAETGWYAPNPIARLLLERNIAADDDATSILPEFWNYHMDGCRPENYPGFLNHRINTLGEFLPVTNRLVDSWWAISTWISCSPVELGCNKWYPWYDSMVNEAVCEISCFWFALSPGRK